ncbi:MAG: hypothetical protein VYC95_04890, partial [Verrucomicrobiota bacterium]|nr:hypothetical protein [Verrucomicrobiota bacterium]
FATLQIGLLHLVFSVFRRFENTSPVGLDFRAGHGATAFQKSGFFRRAVPFPLRVATWLIPSG